jgi:hypothetical protein
VHGPYEKFSAATGSAGIALQDRATMAVAGLAAVAVGGAVACDPGGLSTASVAYTTDRTATTELDRQPSTAPVCAGT